MRERHRKNSEQKDKTKPSNPYFHQNNLRFRRLQFRFYRDEGKEFTMKRRNLTDERFSEVGGLFFSFN